MGGAVPSIFIEPSKEPDIPGTSNSSDRDTCVQLNEKNAQLMKEISKLTINSDIQRQSMQQTIDALKKKLTEQKKILDGTRKELRQSALQNEQFQFSLTNLRKDVCSTLKGPNVSVMLLIS